MARSLSKHVKIFLTNEEHHRLQAIADDDGVKMSALVRIFINTEWRKRAHLHNNETRDTPATTTLSHPLIRQTEELAEEEMPAPGTKERRIYDAEIEWGYRKRPTINSTPTTATAAPTQQPNITHDPSDDHYDETEEWD